MSEMYSRNLFYNPEVKVVRLDEKAILPTRGSEKAAGFDLYACLDEPVGVLPHSTVKVSTGLAITPPEGYFGAIFARSGLATKFGIRPSNCTGVCDADYTGPYIVALHNDSEETYIVEPGDRIAQLVFLPYLPQITFKVVDSLEGTERGAGGFGSTGTN